MAKDRKPENGATRGTASRPGGASRAGGARGGKGGRTRPPTQVVAQQRPWGLIIAAVLVVVFAAGAIGYALVQVNKANADKVASIDEISGAKTYDYAAGQKHVNTPVDYKETPPVGGPHDGEWADCTGTVYTVDIRHENAVHSLEHGAVWITYNPDTISSADLATLTALVQDKPFTTLSPYPGLDSTVSLQAWGHQLKVDSATDERVVQFITALRQNRWVYPETGATCQQPNFDVENPPAFDPTPPGADAIPMSGTGGTAASTEMAVASSDQSVDATASAPVSNAEAPASPEVSAEPTVTTGS